MTKTAVLILVVTCCVATDLPGFLSKLEDHESPLDWLLFPLNKDLFWDEHYSKVEKFFHFRRNRPAYYYDVLQMHEIEHILQTRASNLKVETIAGPEASASRWKPRSLRPIIGASNEKENGVIDEFYHSFAQGRAFRVRDFDTFHFQSKCLRWGLESQLNYLFSTTLMVAPKNAVLHRPNWSAENLFILQISGKQTFALYGNPRPLASSVDSLYITPDIKSATIEDQLQKSNASLIELTAGDMLYIPRGMIFNSSTTTSSSAHLSLGMEVGPFSWGFGGVLSECVKASFATWIPVEKSPEEVKSSRLWDEEERVEPHDDLETAKQRRERREKISQLMEERNRERAQKEVRNTGEDNGNEAEVIPGTTKREQDWISIWKNKKEYMKKKAKETASIVKEKNELEEILENLNPLHDSTAHTHENESLAVRNATFQHIERKQIPSSESNKIRETVQKEIERQLFVVSNSTLLLRQAFKPGWVRDRLKSSTDAAYSLLSRKKTLNRLLDMRSVKRYLSKQDLAHQLSLVEASTLIQSIENKFMQAHCTLPCGYLEQIDQIGEISENSWVKSSYRFLTATISEEQGSMVTFRFNQHTLQYSQSVATALNWIIQQSEAFAASTLPHLSPEISVKLVKDLVYVGFLKIATFPSDEQPSRLQEDEVWEDRWAEEDEEEPEEEENEKPEEAPQRDE